MSLGMETTWNNQTSLLSRLYEPSLVGGETEMKMIKYLSYIVLAILIIESIVSIIFQVSTFPIICAITFIYAIITTTFNFYNEEYIS